MQLTFKNADQNSFPSLPASLCKMQFQIAGESPIHSWALLAVLPGTIQAAILGNPELPWRTSKESRVLEFFQAGHPPQSIITARNGNQRSQRHMVL